MCGFSWDNLAKLILRSVFGFSQRHRVIGSSCCSPSLSWSPTRSAPTTTSLSTTATPPPSRSLEGLKCLCEHKNDVANSKVLWVEASPSSHCNRVFNAACLQVRCLGSTESGLRTIIQYDTVQLIYDVDADVEEDELKKLGDNLVSSNKSYMLWCFGLEECVENN